MNIDQARGIALLMNDWHFRRGPRPHVNFQRAPVAHNGREVWIDPHGGWVYKIGVENMDELAVYERCKDMALFTTGPYRLPLTFIVEGVLVQEYVVGSFPDMRDWDTHQWVLEETMRCGDLHDHNVIFDGLHYWIIDMGFDLDAPAWV